MTRARLPNRRVHETREFEFRGLRYSVGIGRFDDGSVAEVFLECAKAQSHSDADARDAAIAISLGLQHGVSAESLLSSVTRDSHGEPSSVIGAALDAIADCRGARSWT